MLSILHYPLHHDRWPPDGWDRSPTGRASLSRSLRRPEDRGLIRPRRDLVSRYESFTDDDTFIHESRRTTRVELTAAGRVLAEEGGARSWQ
jgi:DNA-binding MarR family transcriptional regulator